MQIHSINSEAKLASIASSIGRNPSSWHNWSVLHIEVCNLGHDRYDEECLLWVQSVLGSYLREVEGRAYLCSGPSIHVLCKNISADILELAGEQICALMLEEDSLLADFKVHTLRDDGLDYVSDFFSRQKDVLRLAGKRYEDFSKCFSRQLMPQDFEEEFISGQNGHGATVMLVEDDPVTRWMVRNTLKNDCQVVTACNASQAFSKFNAVQPDIVFMDIDLPDKSGRDVLGWIMQNDPGACVVMFSGNNDLDTISESIEEGASGFISKPFLKEDFIGYIRTFQYREMA